MLTTAPRFSCCFLLLGGQFRKTLDWTLWWLNTSLEAGFADRFVQWQQFPEDFRWWWVHICWGLPRLQMPSHWTALCMFASDSAFSFSTFETTFETESMGSPKCWACFVHAGLVESLVKGQFFHQQFRPHQKTPNLQFCRKTWKKNLTEIGCSCYLPTAQGGSSYTLYVCLTLLESFFWGSGVDVGESVKFSFQ